MTHDEKIARWIGPGKIGVEIGAFKSPVPGLHPPPFYVDCFQEFGREKVQADYHGEACRLPFRDNSLDYVVTSHVLEHVANPVGALAEWYRVLRSGGIIYLVVPDRRLTWDRPRPLTPVNHLLEDFQRHITACDPTHIEDFVWGVEDTFFGPGLARAELEVRRARLAAEMHNAIRQGLEINIHFHTFEPSNLLDLLRKLPEWPLTRFTWEIVDHAEAFPSNNPIGFLAVVRVHKRLRDRWAGWSLRRRTRRDRRFALQPDARPFAALAPDVPATASGGTAPSAAFVNSAPAFPASLDTPTGASPVDPLCFQVQGWVWLATAQTEIAAVEVWAHDTQVGETTALHARDDVSAALALPTTAQTAFDFFACHPTAVFSQPFELHLRVRHRDGSRTAPLATRTVPTIARDYRQADYGILLDPPTIALHHRINIYTSGPSLSSPSTELAALLRRHLGPPPRRVIDVGCGMGSYGRGLLAAGYDWHGAEVKPGDCAELARLGLPHRQVDGRTLPFDDGAFDSALCIEVLEHIEEPHAFLAEVHRVAPRQLIVSVPNCELLSYLSPHLAVPWHMLEADHKNFFTRWSLASLLRQYYPQVEVGFHTLHPLRTVEGTPLHYHLLAVASTPPRD